jgi:energy-coupling factor transporter ATP-binding protein EcfA2
MRTRVSADEKLRLIEKVLQGRDFTVMRREVNAVEAWLSSLPGHGLCQCAPATGFNSEPRPYAAAVGGLGGDRSATSIWTGHRCFTRARKAQPRFAFRTHVGDVGHTLIVGPTGAGKSVLLALMALQFRRYAGAQVFAFDLVARSVLQRLAWAAIGTMWVACSPRKSRSSPTLRTHRRFHRAQLGHAMGWTGAISRAKAYRIDPECQGSSLVSTDERLPPPRNRERTLTGLSVLLQSQDLKRALEPYTLAESLGTVARCRGRASR